MKRNRVKAFPTSGLLLLVRVLHLILLTPPQVYGFLKADSSIWFRSVARIEGHLSPRSGRNLPSYQNIYATPPGVVSQSRHGYGRDRYAKNGSLSLLDLVMNSTDSYKETSRLYRRTVFSEQDWIHFRSSGRIFDNVASMFTSGVIRGLWLEIGSICAVSILVFLVNAATSAGALEPFIPATDDPAFSLPSLPFVLSSPALALLLVFRTNSVYTRWNQARASWDRIQTHCTNLARMGLIYLHPDEREDSVRRVLALAHVFLRHFRRRGCVEEDVALAARLAALLGSRDAARLLAAADRPAQALADLSLFFRHSSALDGPIRGRFELQLDALTAALVECDGLRRSPVPLVYTRHTGRFLGLWLLFLPLALVRSLAAAPLLVVPVGSLLSLFLLGIFELGVQIEEPCSILPLEHFVARIEADAHQLLRASADVKVVRPAIGADAAPMLSESCGPAWVDHDGDSDPFGAPGRSQSEDDDE